MYCLELRESPELTMKHITGKALNGLILKIADLQKLTSG